MHQPSPAVASTNINIVLSHLWTDAAMSLTMMLPLRVMGAYSPVLMTLRVAVTVAGAS
jgi:hypothetical protein